MDIFGNVIQLIFLRQINHNLCKKLLLNKTHLIFHQKFLIYFIKFINFHICLLNINLLRDLNFHRLFSQKMAQYFYFNIIYFFQNFLFFLVLKKIIQFIFYFCQLQKIIID